MNRFPALALSLVMMTLPVQAWSASDEPGAADEPSADEEAPARLSPEEASRIIALPPPSTGGDKKKEIDFYVRRQQAAFAVGNGEVRLASLRWLVELTKSEDKPSPWLTYLWRELWRSGNQTEAFEVGEVVAADRRYTPAQQASYLARLGNDYLRARQLDKARRALAEAEKELLRPADENSRPRRELRTYIEHLQAGLLVAEGDPAGAEEQIRKAVVRSQQDAEAAKKRAAGSKGDTAYDVAIRTRTSQMQRYVTILVAQGKNVEAEGVARYGIQLADEDRTGGVTLAYWYTSLANAKIGQRRYEEARAAASQAIAILRESGADSSSDRMIVAQTYLIHALFGLERWADADQVATQMREDTVDDALARARADSPVVRAFLHVMNGRSQQGMERIERTIRYRARNFGEKAVTTIEAKSVRAMIYQAQGQTRDALKDYAEVLDSVFSPETSFADGEPAGLRGFILPHALRAYMRLATSDYKENGGKLSRPELLDDSFRVADRLRASSVQQALADSSARAAAANPQLAETIRREQDQRARMRELTRVLTTQLEHDRKLAEQSRERQKAIKDDKKAMAGEVAAEKERAKARAANVKKQRETLQAADEDRRGVVRELRKRFPEYQALVNPKSPRTNEVASLLRRGEGLVSIYAAPEGTFVWAISPGADAAFHYSPLKAGEIAAMVRRIRGSLELGDRPDPAALFDFESSARLHAELLAPVWSRVAESRVIIFAANGSLAEIPFALLVTAPGKHDLGSAPWLARKAAVAQISTVAAFQALRQTRKSSGADKAFAGFGDPEFKLAGSGNARTQGGTVRALVKAPLGLRTASLRDFDFGSLPPLPETRAEILAIAQALGADPAADTYLGAKASREAALGADLVSRRVVAFATHGLKPGDLPGLSRPALALAVTSVPGELPLLVLDDVMGMRLNAELVVLSACNTASDDGSAEEAFSGLARGFFFAGARSVLATHWAVETVSAEQLVKGMFAHLARSSTLTRAEALRRSQMELIEGKDGGKFQHPYFWAPYALSGDPAI